MTGRGIAFHKLEEEQDTERILSCLGGYEIAGLVGVFLGGKKYGVPIVIDGLIAAVAALIAERLKPGCKDYMLFPHLGRKGYEDDFRRTAVKTGDSRGFSLRRRNRSSYAFPTVRYGKGSV